DALILRVKELVIRCTTNEATSKSFGCYLVAHSMGGLVCRAFLQNDKFGSKEARGSVKKFFTYATPHNGIDVAGVNVPEWMKWFDVRTFNRDYMAEYLDI